MKNYPILLLFSVCILSYSFANAQSITGFWRGKIDRKNVELKIIKNGDSLTGTSYYYESLNNYRRYTIKGYFDDRDNSVVWWDDQLIEAKNNNRVVAAKPATPYLSTADFNCPGGTKMYLTGKAALKDKAEQQKGPVDLQKFFEHSFNDEWDFVIDNYTLGANDPELIDSVGKLVFSKPTPIEPTLEEQTAQKPSPKVVAVQPKKQVSIPATKNKPAVQSKPDPIKEPILTVAVLNNEQKFTIRPQTSDAGDTRQWRFDRIEVLR
jgi:hypothetical protein